jgi:flavorubredoxin
MNNNLFPTVADLFFYIKGLKPLNLLGFAFGSYGWSGESITQAEDFLKEMNVEITEQPVKAKYVPDDAILKECFDKGANLAKRLKEICAS